MAATRVTGRDKLLIMRPFPASPFQKGNSIGRELLLQVWRGDRVDWEALRAKYLEERACGECGENKNKAAFTVGQWNRKDADRVCRECTARHRDAGEPYQCSICRLWFSEEVFPMKHRRNANSFYRVCHACELRKPCYICHIKKAECEYSASAWKSRHADRRVCTACVGTKKAKGQWTCAACHRSVWQHSFTMWRRRRHSGQDGTQVCDECYRTTTLKSVTAKARGRLRERRAKIRRRAIVEEVRAEIETMVRARSRQPPSPKPRSPKQTQPPTAPGAERETKHNTAQPQPGVAAVPESAICRKRALNGNEARSSAQPAPVPKRGRDNRPSTDVEDKTMSPPAADVGGIRGRHAKRMDREIIYTCPHCMMAVCSTTHNGTITTRTHCGKQFRVKNGQVIRPYRHMCPHCGTNVVSRKATGRIQVQHTMPNGKPCKTTQWNAVA